MQKLADIGTSAYATGTKAYTTLQTSIVSVIAMFVLPLVVSILTLRASANKDSMQNYTVMALIITGSYLAGAVGYVLILRSGMDSDSQLVTLLSLVMLCTAVLVSTGGAATLVWDADATVKTILKQ
jgi:hypothetical protein